MLKGPMDQMFSVLENLRPTEMGLENLGRIEMNWNGPWKPRANWTRGRLIKCLASLKTLSPFGRHYGHYGHLAHLGLELRTGGEWGNTVRREYKGVSSVLSVYL